MTPEEANEESVNSLREQGYAVIVFNPTELEGADPEHVSERLIELGWEIIQQLGEPK